MGPVSSSSGWDRLSGSPPKTTPACYFPVSSSPVYSAFPCALGKSGPCHLRGASQLKPKDRRGHQKVHTPVPTACQCRGGSRLPGLLTEHLWSPSLISGTECQVVPPRWVPEAPPSLLALFISIEFLSHCRAPAPPARKPGQQAHQPPHCSAPPCSLLEPPLNLTTRSWDALLPFTI
ncbi:hypothetical protein LEMLEM_LOCUS18853 [Lemmus lemmus]